MTWGELSTLSWTWAESLPLAACRGSGRRTTACWTLSSLPGRPTPSSFIAATLGLALARLMTGACEPRGSSPGWQLCLTAHWTFFWGPRGTGRGAHTWRLDIGPPMGSWKWTGATRQERAEPHRQFTRTDDFIAQCYLNCDPCGHHWGRQHARTIRVIMWRYWTVCRSSRIDLPRPHQAV